MEPVILYQTSCSLLTSSTVGSNRAPLEGSSWQADPVPQTDCDATLPSSGRGCGSVDPEGVDRLIEFCGAEELTGFKSGQNMRCAMFYRGFNSRLILRFSHARRHEAEIVIPCKICVGRIEHRDLPVRASHRRFQVIADNHLGNRSQKLQTSHMGRNPTAQSLIGHRFHIGIIRTSHGRHEDLGLGDFARIRIHHLHRLACEVHIQSLACLMMNPYRDLLGTTPLFVTRTEMPIAVPIRTLLNPVKPDPLQGHALAREVLIGLRPVWLGTRGDAARMRK